MRKLITKPKKLQASIFKYNILMISICYFFYKGQRLSKEAKVILVEWFSENINHPYATEETKRYLAWKTNLTKDQVKNWIKNERIKFYSSL